MKRKIVVLMSTYNGEKYLRGQIDSVLNQDLDKRLPVGVEIFVRDDGSSDRSSEILKQYAERGELAFYTGENIGYKKSFWRLLADAPQADYYAFCDQDDVWFSDKLYRAVKKIIIEEKRKTGPVLYISDNVLTDENLNPLKQKRIKHVIGFPYALIYSYGAGCCQVFNSKAREVLLKYDMEKDMETYHDFLTQKIVALYGTIIYDARPSLYYRQHKMNAVGLRGFGICGKIRRFLFDSVNDRSDAAGEILRIYEKDRRIPADRLDMLKLLANYRKDLCLYFRLLSDKRFRGGIKEDYYLILLIILRRL